MGLVTDIDGDVDLEVVVDIDRDVDVVEWGVVEAAIVVAGVLDVWDVAVTIWVVVDEVTPPTQTLFPQVAPGLQALHTAPTLHWIVGKLQHTALSS